MSDILSRFSLQGRVALVTAGAGPLFGSSISEALASAGATLITASRSLERNQQFADRLRRHGHDAHGLAFDLSDVNSIEQLRDDVLARFGRLDVLVNCALGREGYAGGFDEQTTDDWLAAAQSDMVGLFGVVKAFLPAMIEAGRGSIINVASIYGIVSNDPGIYAGTEMRQPPNYTFVKGGMLNFTRYLAAYYGRHGVRTNALSPGGYFNDQPAPFVEAYNRRVPLGRMMNHEDIAGAAVFLASDASAYVNGHNLVVDGGWTAI